MPDKITKFVCTLLTFILWPTWTFCAAVHALTNIHRRLAWHAMYVAWPGWSQAVTRLVAEGVPYHLAVQSC